VDAFLRLKEIVGHFNPEMARRTEDNKSIRGCFGRSKMQNCVFKMFEGQKKSLALKFWFGGRVKNTKFLINATGIQQVQKFNQMHLLCPAPAEDYYFLLSPII